MIDDEPIEPRRGVYDTRRASALSGVPYETLHYWARKGIYLPSINPEPRTRLWSWGDLLAVRAIYWFRRGGSDEGDIDRIRPVPMPRIRDMLATIEQAGESREQLTRLVAVSEHGDLYLRFSDGPVIQANRGGQLLLANVIPLVMPFLKAPDLLRPRELLRIVPGKLHGEPHVMRTRIATAVLYRLSEMGYPPSDILEMYPDVASSALEQALDLERTLQRAA